MKQVVAIHGGDIYRSYDEYLAALRGLEVASVDWFKPGADWKGNLQEALGPDYEVLLPRMPNKQNAKYEEWKIWFEKLIPFLRDGVILVGHSLGGAFLAKYLSENELPNKIAATLLVAAPYGEGEFSFDSLEKLQARGGKIFIYQSKDDPVVSPDNAEHYAAALPTATMRMFEDRRHFNQPGFPELIADIQNL